MKLTAGDAGRKVGKSTSTITRDVQKGKIPGTKRKDGAWAIDEEELFRVYPRVAPEEPANDAATAGGDDPQAVGVSAAMESLQGLTLILLATLQTITVERERERQQLTDQIEDLRRRLDSETAERRALTQPPPAIQQPEPLQPEPSNPYALPGTTYESTTGRVTYHGGWSPTPWFSPPKRKE